MKACRWTNHNQEENYIKLNKTNVGIVTLGNRVTNQEAKVSEISSLKESLASVRETLRAAERDLSSLNDRLAYFDEGLGGMSNKNRRNDLVDIIGLA